MERRRTNRTKKRLACEMEVGGARHSGIVLDISKTGLFVQTSAKPKPGAEVALTLKIPGWSEPLHLEAKVARMKAVPPQLTAVAQGGLGLHVPNPSPAFLRWVKDVEAGERKSDEATERERKQQEKRKSVRRTRFRVNVARPDGTEPNTYLMAATNEEQAGERVLAELGGDWKVISVEVA